MKKIKVGILGATGMVGQQYLQRLKEHPWFEISFLASSETSAGKKYKDAVENRWYQKEPLDNELGKLSIHSIEDIESCHKNCHFVFSALPTNAAKIYEEKYASAEIPEISNASYHRASIDVPVLLPEVNAKHLELIHYQQKRRGWKKGFIVVKPNCSLQSYVIPLEALRKQFPLKKILVTTLQAISGAGYPGISALDIHDNIIPFIQGEEEKSEQEPLKIWGTLERDKILPSNDIQLSVHCNRVPVMDGHMACVSVEFAHKPSSEAIIEAWQNFRGEPQKLDLPEAPSQPIVYKQEINRPQTRLDRMEGNGMAITVGRLRECPIFHYRFVGLSHNTIRGAAGGGILNAELIYKQGYIY